MAAATYRSSRISPGWPIVPARALADRSMSHSAKRVAAQAAKNMQTTMPMLGRLSASPTASQATLDAMIRSSQSGSMETVTCE